MQYDPKRERAFPVQTDVEHNSGMMILDYFAAKAMQAMVSSKAYADGEWPMDQLAAQAYEIAEAMVKVRTEYF